MNYEICGNNLIVAEKTRSFNVAQTLGCGQVFRYRLWQGGGEVLSLFHKAVFEEKQDEIKIICDDAKYFAKYLDFDRNYDIIMEKVSDKASVSTATAFAPGIRILAQDTFETVVSFIISANNRIPRIQSIIERICAACGEKMPSGDFAFPTLSALTSLSEQDFQSFGAGYRAPYLKKTLALLCNIDLSALRSLPTEQAADVLLALPGVGPKVADCILLFGLGKTDVFPVDTWIKKVYRDMFGDATTKAMRKNLVAEYGELSGFVQQYLFYYKRETNK